MSGSFENNYQRKQAIRRFCNDISTEQIQAAVEAGVTAETVIGALRKTIAATGIVAGNFEWLQELTDEELEVDDRMLLQAAYDDVTQACAALAPFQKDETP